MIGSENRLLLDSRSNELKKIFQEIDGNKNQVLNLDELSKYLSKKSGKSFSNELLQEIFRAIDRDKDSNITLDEFVTGYSKAETLIKEKIEELKAQISMSKKNLAESKKQLIESKVRKSENVLTVKVLNASGIKSTGISGLKGPVISILIEGQEITTNPADPTSLEWNEIFSFQIMKGDGDIMIQLFDTDRRKKLPKAIGKLAIPMEILEDQKSHFETFELHSENEVDKITGKLNLELH